MTDDLLIPASYDVWLTDLKHHLDRTPGSKAALARYLVHVRDWKADTAKVYVSKIIGSKLTPAADLFIDIAAWLQRQQEGAGDSARLERADEP
jgi:hypothetical protein